MPISNAIISRRGSSCQDVFRECKERVSCAEIATFYGYHPNRAGFICCPFHAERTASLKLYSNSWYCYGCKCGGDVVDFTARLHGLSMMDAVAKLNSDFNLGLSLEPTHTPTAAELKVAREEREVERTLTYTLQRFEDWRIPTVAALNDCMYLANMALKYKTPAEWTDAETLAIRLYPELEFYADALDDDRTEAASRHQLFIYRNKEGIEALCNAIL